MFSFELSELLLLIGYPGLAAIIFAESGTIIGFLLPGASLLFTAGFLSSQGILDIRIIIPLVAVAAILGDNASYWLGAKVGIHLFDRPDSRFFKRSHLERTRRFYAQYGSRMILFARFIPMVRTFAPVLAGVAGMNYRVFMFYNVIGGVLWAGGIAYSGYLLGDTFPQVADYFETAILAIVLITCLPLAWGFFRHRFDRLPAVRAIIFDLDGTLSEPFTPASPDTIKRLEKLLDIMPVAFLSGATLERMRTSLLDQLSRGHENILALPVNGAQGYAYTGDTWQLLYDETLDTPERETIMAALEKVKSHRDLTDLEPAGETVVDRRGYIAFTALGVDAPKSAKLAWDPTSEKRRSIIKDLAVLLPGYDIYVGGTTTIDIMRKGVNKAYGIDKISTHWSFHAADMLFIGDALYPGGNDYPVMTTGVRTIQVTHPTETARIIDKYLNRRDSDTSRT